MKEISDGNLYTANDMVKADCQDCKAVLRAAVVWVILLCWILMMSGR